MATKHYCDICNHECEKGERLYDISVYRHVGLRRSLETKKTYKNLTGHITKHKDAFQPVSNVQDNIELCLTCYNEVAYSHVDAIIQLKNKHTNDK